jgi:hypothetical protein
MGTAQFYWQTVDNGPTQLDQLHMLTPEELKNADTFKNLVNVDRANNRFLVVIAPISVTSLLKPKDVSGLAADLPSGGWTSCIDHGNAENPFHKLGSMTNKGLSACAMHVIPATIGVPHLSGEWYVFQVDSYVTTNAVGDLPDRRFVVAFKPVSALVFIKLDDSEPQCAPHPQWTDAAGQFASAAVNQNISNAANDFKRRTADFESPDCSNVDLSKVVYSNFLYDYQNQARGGYNIVSVFSPVGMFCQGAPTSICSATRLIVLEQIAARAAAESECAQGKMTKAQLALIPNPLPQREDSYKSMDCMGMGIPFEHLQEIFPMIEKFNQVSFFKTEGISKKLPVKAKDLMTDCDEVDHDTTAAGIKIPDGVIDVDHTFTVQGRGLVLAFLTQPVMNAATTLQGSDQSKAQAKAIDPDKFAKAVVKHGKNLRDGTEINKSITGFLSPASPMAGRKADKRVDVTHLLKYILHPSSGKIPEKDFLAAAAYDAQQAAVNGRFHPLRHEYTSFAAFNTLAAQ